MSRYTYDKTSKELDIIAGVPAMDSAPVEDSIKPITSGGVYDVVDPMLNELGAKNLLPNHATTQTVSGVTFTIRDDGSVALSGRANALIDFPLSPIYLAFNQIKAGDILSGCPVGGSEETYCLICGGSTRYATDTGNGDALSNIDLSYGYKVAIRIHSNVDVTGLVFYPMIRLASIKDDTYVPYAMTNRELTEQITNIGTLLETENAIHPTTQGATFDICSLTLPKGVWAVTCYSELNYDSTSTYVSYLGYNNAHYTVRQNGAGGGGIDVTRYIKVDSPITVYAKGYALAELVNTSTRKQHSIIQAIRIA